MQPNFNNQGTDNENYKIPETNESTSEKINFLQQEIKHCLSVSKRYSNDAAMVDYLNIKIVNLQKELNLLNVNSDSNSNPVNKANIQEGNEKTQWVRPEGYESVEMYEMSKFISEPNFLKVYNSFPIRKRYDIKSEHYNRHDPGHSYYDDFQREELVPAYFSDKLIFVDKMNKTRREVYIMYSFNKDNGELEPYIAYKSLSDGFWRVSVPNEVYLEQGMAFSKGEHYTRSGRMLTDLFQAEERDTDKASIEYDISELYKFQTRMNEDIQKTHLRKYGEQVEEKLHIPDFNTDNYDVAINGSFNQKDLKYLSIEDVEHFKLGSSLMPDFEKVDHPQSYITHPLIGVASLFYVDSDEFSYQIAVPKDGSLPWVSDVFDKYNLAYGIDFNDLTSYFTSKKIYDFGLLDLKPVEYADNVPDKLRPLCVFLDNTYLDIRPVLCHTEFMKKFIKRLSEINFDPDMYRYSNGLIGTTPFKLRAEQIKNSTEKK